MPLPKILKNFNMFVTGVGFAGRVDTIELPKLNMQFEEHRAGGMDAPASIDMGMEGIECSFESAEHDPAVFSQFGIQNGAAVQLQFRAANRDDFTTEEYEVWVNGAYSSLDPGTLKAGDKTPLKATVVARYYRLTVSGAVLIEIDIENMLRIIDGTDVLEEIRAVLLM